MVFPSETTQILENVVGECFLLLNLLKWTIRIEDSQKDHAWKRNGLDVNGLRRPCIVSQMLITLQYLILFSTNPAVILIFLANVDYEFFFLLYCIK